MIEFKQASTGTEVFVAQLADATAYVFRLKHLPNPKVWWLTCNRLGIAGHQIGEADFEAVKIAALRYLAHVAARRAQLLAALAAECAAEAAFLSQPEPPKGEAK